MPQRPQPLPTAPSLNDTERLFARQFAMLLGPWYGAADGTRNAAEVEGIGESLAESSGTNESVGREAFVNLASALLHEWEALYTGTQTTAFLTDDPDSLTDNTVLRA